MVATALWSLELHPGQSYPVLVRRDFVITTATFGDEIVEGTENTRSVVKVTHVPVSQRELMDSDDEMSLGDSDEEDEDSEEEDDEEEEEEVAAVATGKNGKKASKAAAAAAAVDAEMEELDDGEEEEEDEDESDDEDFEDEEELAQTCIASLIPGKIENVNMNLTFVEEDAVMFEVTGKNVVHLSGNYVDQQPLSGMDDYPSDLEDDEDDSEIDSDEEGLYDEDDDDLVSLTSSQEEDMQKMLGIESAEGRITPVEDDDEEEAAAEKKSVTKKRKAETQEVESPAAASKSAAAAATDGLTKTQKKKLNKKLKAEGGEAAEAPAATAAAKAAAPAEKKEKAAAKPEQASSKKRTTASGLVIEDIKTGDGPIAKSGKKCQMRYIGKLTNGKQFDANTSGAPFSFALGRGEVIKGWDEGVQGMKVGGERRLTVPAKLAYGSQKLPGIPANSTLVFDIKLVGVRG